MPQAANDASYARKFVWIAAIGCALLSLIPTLYGMLMAPHGSQFLGYPYATDDHMVYAAWIKQAQSGNFFFDNRFAIDDQPRLTIHIYFFVVGLISKLTGISLATAIAKAALSFSFVWLLYRLVSRIATDSYTTKLLIPFVVFGGGIGFSVWHEFGEAITKTNVPEFLSNLMLGRLPTDVWQPEGFVFPSMLTNSLFMAALCLILVVVECILASKENAKAPWIGAVAMLLLMNIHSYDVLILALVGFGFLAMQVSQKQMSLAWFGRCVIIFLGAVPSALWFVNVIQNDPVFQARAATETFSPNFRQILFGYLFFLVLGIAGIVAAPRAKQNLGAIAAGLLASLIAVLFITAGQVGRGYFLTPPMFLIVYVVAILICIVAASENTMLNWIVAWAVVGLIAPYFPALFQRKLAMGLMIPWAILGGYALTRFLQPLEKGKRNLVGAFTIIVTCASSLLWLQREMLFIRDDVSRTTVHSLQLGPDVQQILAKLNEVSQNRTVVLCLPGIAQKGYDKAGNEIPDSFLSPIVPDLNPILSGFAGVYTFAGHWSETPDYNRRRAEATNFFLGQWTEEQRTQFLRDKKIQYIVAPKLGSIPAFASMPMVDATQYGSVEVDGELYRLIKVR